VTFALLVLAWYLTYRKPKAACEQGSKCVTKPVAKWNKVVLWFATGFVLIAAAFPSLSSAILRFGQTSSDACCPLSVVTGANTAVLQVKIPSMDCAACAIGIQFHLAEAARRAERPSELRHQRSRGAIRRHETFAGENHLGD
jgi:hypothetical protein